MEHISDTLLVSIELVAQTEESVVEVVTHLGQTRNVINVFRGADAELIYRTLINKRLIEAHVEKLKSLPNTSTGIRLFNSEPPEDPYFLSQYYDFKDDAEENLARIKAAILGYEYITVAQYKKLIGFYPYPADHMRGWASLDELCVKETEEGCFYIYVPDFTELKCKEEIEEEPCYQ